MMEHRIGDKVIELPTVAFVFTETSVLLFRATEIKKSSMRYGGLRIAGIIEGVIWKIPNSKTPPVGAFKCSIRNVVFSVEDMRQRFHEMKTKLLEQKLKSYMYWSDQAEAAIREMIKMGNEREELAESVMKINNLAIEALTSEIEKTREAVKQFTAFFEEIEANGHW